MTVEKENTFRYLVAPDAGFFGNKVVESILHLRISWNQQKKLPHTKSDPIGHQTQKKVPLVASFLTTVTVEQ